MSRPATIATRNQPARPIGTHHHGSTLPPRKVRQLHDDRPAPVANDLIAGRVSAAGEPASLTQRPGQLRAALLRLVIRRGIAQAGEPRGHLAGARGRVLEDPAILPDQHRHASRLNSAACRHAA